MLRSWRISRHLPGSAVERWEFIRKLLLISLPLLPDHWRIVGVAGTLAVRLADGAIRRKLRDGS
jgi:hypothetical protein